MNGDLHGKTAIVTGTGRGLGRSMALGLARAGVNVVITAARHRSEIDQVAQEGAKIPSAGAIRPMIADVANEEDAQRVVSEALREFGALHILVNNAGRGMRFVSEKFFRCAHEILGNRSRRVENDRRHKRQRPIPDGPRRRTAHDQSTMGPHHQHIDQSRNDAPSRLLALRSVQGGA